MLYYQHPSPAEIRWLTAIVADEGFKVQSSSAGPDLWVKKLTRATLVFPLSFRSPADLPATGR